uniref:Uncharacterized protein n=1 Tax=Rhizophora mucronata TaxID=61149 RepID=A0A2P2K8N2_RHIMU
MNFFASTRTHHCSSSFFLLIPLRISAIQ